MSDFPPEKKTGENIKKESVRSCAKLGYEEAMLEKAVFVTDKGANIITVLYCSTNALCTSSRMNCTATY